MNNKVYAGGKRHLVIINKIDKNMIAILMKKRAKIIF